MIEPAESESLAEFDRFCETMIECGAVDRQNNPLKHAPHTADLLIAEWTRSYPHEQVLFPTAATRTDKYWPSLARVDSAYGDRQLAAVLDRQREMNARLATISALLADIEDPRSAAPVGDPIERLLTAFEEGTDAEEGTIELLPDLLSARMRAARRFSSAKFTGEGGTRLSRRA